jgi:hypothetical protein
VAHTEGLDLLFGVRLGQPVDVFKIRFDIHFHRRGAEHAEALYYFFSLLHVPDYTLDGGRRRQPNIRVRMNKTMKIKNNIFAMPAKAIAIPVKPNRAAIREIIKNTSAQYNILKYLLNLYRRS